MGEFIDGFLYFMGQLKMTPRIAGETFAFVTVCTMVLASPVAFLVGARYLYCRLKR